MWTLGDKGKRSQRKWRLYAAVLFALSIFGSAAAHAVRPHTVPSSLEGVSLGGALEGECWQAVDTLADAWLDTPITLIVGDSALHETRRALGAQVDVDASWNHGYNARSLVRRFDPNQATAALERLRSDFDVLPLVAGVDPFTARAIPGREGHVVSGLAALATLERALLANDILITLPMQTLPVPEASLLPMGQALYTRTLTTYTTHYATRDEQWGRVRNIETSAAAIDGVIIPPRGEFSFNGIVGERTIDRGYRPAKEVASGRLVDGIGGGICQVAATLHAACFLAGLEIAEHHPHTRGSSYIAVGLDASIGWPNQDLRIRNPFAFPVRIRALTARGELTVELRGAAEAPLVTWSVEEIEWLQRDEQISTDSSSEFAMGEVIDEGVDGLIVERLRTIQIGARVIRERQFLEYPPVDVLIQGGTVP